MKGSHTQPAHTCASLQGILVLWKGAPYCHILCDTTVPQFSGYSVSCNHLLHKHHLKGGGPTQVHRLLGERGDGEERIDHVVGTCLQATEICLNSILNLKLSQIPSPKSQHCCSCASPPEGGAQYM